MGSRSKNQPESIVLPWIRKYGWTDFYVLFCLAALIFQHRQNFSPRGLVFPDRADTLDRWPRPKSLRRTGLSGWFWIWVSSAAGGATIHELCRKSSAGCLPMIAHNAMAFLFFFLAPYFTCNDSDPVQIWSHLSRSARLGIQDALSYPESHGYACAI